MRLVRGRIPPGTLRGGTVVTIGKFDGLHRGHRAVLTGAAAAARARSCSLVMLSFEPLPYEFFTGSRAPARLARFVTKWRLVESAASVDMLACLRFDASLAGQEAEDFVDESLVEGLGIRAVVVGEAFRFGRKRRGDVDLLRRLGHARGFEVITTPAVEDSDGRISSSRVRMALLEHRLDDAARLLDQPYRIYGRVAKGDRLGTRLGFPTANLPLGRRSPPLAGIYVVKASGLPGGARHGVASVGERPTVGGGRRLLEIHFPGHEGELYGRLLAVELLAWLRAEERFADLAALASAVRDDVAAGGVWLRARGLDWNAEGSGS